MEPRPQRASGPKAAAPRPEEPRPHVCLRCDADVILDVVFERGLLFLVLENTGDGPALGVRVKFAAPLVGVDGAKRIDRLSLFRRLEFLAPRKRIEVFLDRSAAFFARGDDPRLVVAVSWRTTDGDRRSRTIEHDLEIYRDLGYIDRKVPHRAEPA